MHITRTAYNIKNYIHIHIIYHVKIHIILKVPIVPYTFNTQDRKVQLIKAFINICQLPQLRCPIDVVGDVVRDGDNKDPPPPPPPALFGLSAFTFLSIMLSHTGGKLYLPPSLLRLGLRALIYIASFTPPQFNFFILCIECIRNCVISRPGYVGLHLLKVIHSIIKYMNSILKRLYIQPFKIISILDTMLSTTLYMNACYPRIFPALNSLTISNCCINCIIIHLHM